MLLLRLESKKVAGDAGPCRPPEKSGFYFECNEKPLEGFEQ